MRRYLAEDEAHACGLPMVQCECGEENLAGYAIDHARLCPWVKRTTRQTPEKRVGR